MLLLELVCVTGLRPHTHSILLAPLLLLVLLLLLLVLLLVLLLLVVLLLHCACTPPLD
jgi:hypothetical protein